MSRFSIFHFIIVGSLLSSTAGAQALSEGVTGHVSIVDVDHIGSTVGLGGAYNTPLSQDWILAIGLDYWSESDRYYHTKVTIRDIAIGGMAKYLFRTSKPKMVPFLGIGAAIHMISAELDDDHSHHHHHRYEDNETQVGLDLGGGVYYRLEPGFSITGELRFREVDFIDHTQLSIGAAKSL